MPTDPLDAFTPATRAWFTGAFAEPTAAQSGAWAAAASGRDALVVAPTGSGKTLAAFLWSLDRLFTEPPPPDPRRRCRVLYVSPLKALAVDVERNLRAPLVGIRQAAARLGVATPDVTVGMRTGDTPADERRRLVTRPPDILITTPESLFLILTSAARESLRSVDTVIVDEVHAVAASKRGAHLALSLERLDALLERPARRMGLSATVRPVEEVARMLGGSHEVDIVQPPASKRIELEVVVPVDDMAELGQPTGEFAGSAAGDGPRASIWPHVEERIVDLVESHRSTIVFANSRRLAERLCARLNEIHAERLLGSSAGLADPTVAPAQVMAQSGASRGAEPVLARAHHGSVSKEQRALIEEDLKAGRLPAVVATSSLELGIDMGAVDLVIQVESPPSVASGLQRVGRAGHQVGAVSRGVVFPKYRGDLVQTAVVAERMVSGEIEALRYPRNPLDVLAQQVVAMVAMDDWAVDELLAVVRRAASFAGLPQSAYDAVLDMLAGRYPSDAFAELRPRLVWDRVAGTLSARPGAQRLAVTSGGTIPDRGLFGVFLVGGQARGAGASTGTGGKGGTRVGELDEEMVYESRIGDVFTLGSSAWRIEEITHDRVLVSPAPGQPGRLPFWKGDALGRPAELGRAVGGFVRELGRLAPEVATARLRAGGLDERAADNLLAYLAEQRTATGHVPDDRTILIERFRDELGDWRVVIHSPFGAQVHAPWALALAGRLRERYGVDVQAMHADDGIVLRLPDMDLVGGPAGISGATLGGTAGGIAGGTDLGSSDLGVLDLGGSDLGVLDLGGSDLGAVLSVMTLLEPEDVEALVTSEVAGSALFAARFRECAARALLLPRRDHTRRTPLWQQRQRSAQLLSVASDYGSFPVVLETMREVLQDVFDVPALVALMKDVSERRVRIVDIETSEPSPFARSLLFGYVAQFLYEGDSPLAERRAATLSLDSTLLAELLGQADLRELLDFGAVDAVEADLQRLSRDRQAHALEGVADLLRILGPLTTEEALARGATAQWLHELETARRAIRVRMSTTTHTRPGSTVAPDDGHPQDGHSIEYWAAIEDAGRLRDALGTPLPVGIPEAFLELLADPLGDLVARYARTHGPFHTADVARRLGLGVAVVHGALARLAGTGRVVEGEFRPGGSGAEWCDTEVLRMLRRRSLAILRQEAEPVAPAALARFLPRWQGIGAGLRGVDGVLRVCEQLAGAAVPASALERLVLPSRVMGYSPAMLDELTTSGEVVWAGHGQLPGDDGWVSLHLTETAALTLPTDATFAPSPLQQQMLDALDGGTALFFRGLSERVGSDGPVDDAVLGLALWELVWAGRVTNDTAGPLRGLLAGGSGGAHRARRATPRARYGRPGRAVLPARSAPPTLAGRWSLLPAVEVDGTRRAAALAETLLDRYGVVTRGSVVAERIPGGFAAAYRVLSAFEETGRCRRGYVVQGLGAAQFSVPGAVDRLRAEAGDRRESGPALVLAATDPANAYGAALPWPVRPGADGHRPGRKAGALVVLVDGELALYVERGGRTLLSFTDDLTAVQPAVDALALAVRAGQLGKLQVERADGASVLSSPLGAALEAAGFHATPRGLRLRA
jgi:ATP-dependent helicase Lhr and Lhr-like helicase